MTLPASLTYGHVVGRIILAVADASDADRMPDSAPAQGTVTFTPKNPQVRIGEPAPVLVVKQPITCTLDGTGNLIDPEGAAGVWLVTGVYAVKYSLGPQVASVTHDIEVLSSHTDVAPLDLTTALPPGGPILTASEYAELSSRIDQIESGGVVSVNGAVGVVTLDAADVGALPDTYVPPAAPVDSVNGLTGAVVLDAASVGALPATYTPPAHSHEIADVNGLQAELDSAGGGGGATPTVGSAPGTTVGALARSGSVSGSATWRENRVYVFPAPWFPYGGGSVTITHATIRVTTAVAGSTVRVGIYGSDAYGGFDPTNLLTEVAIPAGATGNVEAALPAAVVLAPDAYWFATCTQGGVPQFNAALPVHTIGVLDPGGAAVGRARSGVAGSLPTDTSLWGPANETDGAAVVGWRVQA